MATEWFVERSGKALGPISSSQLKKLSLEGKISKATKVRRGDRGNWVEASAVKGLFPDETPGADKEEPNLDDILDELGIEKPIPRLCKICKTPTTNVGSECDGCLEIRHTSSAPQPKYQQVKTVNANTQGEKFWTLDLKLKAICLLAIISVVPLYAYFNGTGGGGKENSAQRKITSQFSPWDGSHRNLTKYIQSTMNDPGSYEHVNTYWENKGDHLVVTTTFRGKNAFGGVVMNGVVAEVDLEGNIVQILMTLP